MIVWGSRLYGKVDEIEGIGHVETSFGHLYFFPLIPMGSMFITGREGDEVYGASVPLNSKSILMAWLRAIAVVAVICFFVGVCLSDRGAMGGKLYPSIGLAISVGALVALNLKWAKKASYERAKTLATKLGFDPRLKVFIDLHYGEISEAEADRQMEQLQTGLSDFDNLMDEIQASGMDQPVNLN